MSMYLFPAQLLWLCVCGRTWRVLWQLAAWFARPGRNPHGAFPSRPKHTTHWQARPPSCNSPAPISYQWTALTYLPLRDHTRLRSLAHCKPRVFQVSLFLIHGRQCQPKAAELSCADFRVHSFHSLDICEDHLRNVLLFLSRVFVAARYKKENVQKRRITEEEYFALRKKSNLRAIFFE